MIKLLSKISIACFILIIGSLAQPKDQNACEMISYVAPSTEKTGSSEWRCPLHQNGLKASLITVWKLVDGLPIAAESRAEILLDGKTLVDPVGKLFEGDNPNLGPRTQLIACNGYFDLLLPIEDTTSRNPNFATWRFNVERKRYVLHKPLTALRNPVPVAGCGCYQTYQHGGGDNFSYELWCSREGVLSKTREVVQRSARPTKANELRDYPEAACTVRDTRFDAKGNAKTSRSKRCIDVESVSAETK